MISAEEAEEYTQALGQVFGGGWRLVLHARKQGIPEALGLSVQEWVETRLGGYVRLSVSDRREAARELTAKPEDGGQGMSQREAADVLGVSHQTVNNDLKPEPVKNLTPEPESQQEPALSNESPLVDEDFDWEEPEADESGPEPVKNLTPEPVREPESLETQPEPPKPVAHVGRNSGDNEWYTPAEYVKSATAVLGAIDLDPASSAEANKVVGATGYWTEEDDGLSKPWFGRVWMNPPYAQPWCDRFCTRLAREYRDGDVEAACVLVNNATETGWFQELAAQAAAMCFPRGRVKFWHPAKEATPLQGQAVLYLGPDVAAFRTEFLRFGFVVTL